MYIHTDVEMKYVELAGDLIAWTGLSAFLPIAHRGGVGKESLTGENQWFPSENDLKFTVGSGFPISRYVCTS